jgi:hypothetical protein
MSAAPVLRQHDEDVPSAGTQTAGSILNIAPDRSCSLASVGQLFTLPPPKECCTPLVPSGFFRNYFEAER